MFLCQIIFCPLASILFDPEASFHREQLNPHSDVQWGSIYRVRPR